MFHRCVATTRQLYFLKRFSILEISAPTNVSTCIQRTHNQYAIYGVGRIPYAVCHGIQSVAQTISTHSRMLSIMHGFGKILACNYAFFSDHVQNRLNNSGQVVLLPCLLILFHRPILQVQVAGPGYACWRTEGAYQSTAAATVWNLEVDFVPKALFVCLVDNFYKKIRKHYSSMRPIFGMLIFPNLGKGVQVPQMPLYGGRH